jgi:hypothetical protein
MTISFKCALSSSCCAMQCQVTLLFLVQHHPLLCVCHLYCQIVKVTRLCQPMNLLGQAGGVMAKTESEEDQEKKLVRPRRKLSQCRLGRNGRICSTDLPDALYPLSLCPTPTVGHHISFRRSRRYNMPSSYSMRHRSLTPNVYRLRTRQSDGAEAQSR